MLVCFGAKLVETIWLSLTKALSCCMGFSLSAAFEGQPYSLKNWLELSLESQPAWKLKVENLNLVGWLRAS